VLAVILLVTVALISLLITRVATIALTVTGLSRQSARFQARSALSGVGFTTSESEAVVNHPIRRRIVMALMLLGSLGLATSIAGLLAGFLSADDAAQAGRRAVVLVLGLIAVYGLSLSSAVDRRLSQIGVRLLNRYTDLDVQDYVRLLHLSGEYSVKEMPAEEGDWIVDRSLGDLRLRDEGILVLGIVRRDGSYIGIPGKETVIEPGETVIMYGRDDVFADLAGRPSGPEGDRAHERIRKQLRRLVPGGRKAASSVRRDDAHAESDATVSHVPH
jgi:hypothetical protein